MEKVLLLSASTGGGHNSAAKAIKDSLEKLDCEVSVVDTLKFVSPMLDKIVSSGYEKSAKYVPKTYGAIYKISSKKTSKEELDVFVRRVLGRKVLRLIEDTKPGAIVGTHPFPIMALMKYKEQGTLNIPVISVLTDYSIHPAHVQKNIDAYIAGDEDVGYLLRNAGVEEEKIHPLGIPISGNFLSTDRVDIVRHQLGLEDKFTVLLMGGSFGAGNMKDCFLDLINSRYNFQIVVVTGRDISLRDKLQKLADDIKPDKSIKILGFTKDMPELLTIADVLVSKPGGLTTTEAIIKGTPLVIPYYIPGQEEENIAFLLNNGLALKTFKSYPLSTIIEILIDNPKRRLEIVDRMAKRRKIDASDEIAKLTLKLIQENR